MVFLKTINTDVALTSITFSLTFSLYYIETYLCSISLVGHYAMKIHLFRIPSDDFNEHTISLDYQSNLLIKNHISQSV